MDGVIDAVGVSDAVGVMEGVFDGVEPTLEGDDVGVGDGVTDGAFTHDEPQLKLPVTTFISLSCAQKPTVLPST